MKLLFSKMIMFFIFGTVLCTTCITPPPQPKQGFAQGPHKGMPELSEEDIKMIVIF